MSTLNCTRLDDMEGNYCYTRLENIVDDENNNNVNENLENTKLKEIPVEMRYKNAIYISTV